jgi:type IV secretion system protein VirB9
MKNKLPLIRSILIASASALALSACATRTPPPVISYDSDDFKPAVVEKAPLKEVAIVEVPKVLPLPGQLQPEPGEVAEDKRPPTVRVEDANKAATQEPTKYGYVNAIQVYPYTEGALYQLYATPERVSDIALQPGETLTSVSAGDTVRWVIGDTVSGSGENSRTHVLVKPFAPGINTNLVITTDRRSYHLQLESTEKTAMAAML